MIIFGWGKTTKKFLGGVMIKSCDYCNTESAWQLTVVRTWFTLFFIPIIPYSKMSCIMCPKCGSYIKITQEQFDDLKAKLEDSKSENEVANGEIPDSVKYAGKTQTQINYLKHMESLNKSS